MDVTSIRRVLLYILLAGMLLTEPHLLLANGFRDTIISETQQTNLHFNNIYRQNIDPGFFGNEYGNPIKSTLVADLNPNVILVSSSKSRFFVLFSPRVKLRLLKAPKAPVRSPSYMPGAKIYFRMNNSFERPVFLSAAYSHHSNGQDSPTLDSTGNFNRGSGKFTTNYYTLDYSAGKRRVSSSLSRSKYASIGLELHTGLFGLGYSKELKDQYGFVRINGNLIYDILRGNAENNKYQTHHRIHSKLTYIMDRYESYSFSNISKRLNASIQYSYQPGFTGNVALSFTAGYRGQDDYNIYFEDSYSYVSVGVVYGVAFNLEKKYHKITK